MYCDLKHNNDRYLMYHINTEHKFLSISPKIMARVRLGEFYGFTITFNLLYEIITVK